MPITIYILCPHILSSARAAQIYGSLIILYGMTRQCGRILCYAITTLGIPVIVYFLDNHNLLSVVVVESPFEIKYKQEEKKIPRNIYEK